MFDEEQVQSYYLTLSDEQYAKLTDYSTLLLDPYTVNKDRYVEAALRVGDREFPRIGVRFKGNYSIWGCVDFATGERVERVEPQIAEAVDEDPLVDGVHWREHVDELLADIPRFQANLTLMMSGLIPEYHCCERAGGKGSLAGTRPVPCTDHRAAAFARSGVPTGDG